MLRLLTAVLLLVSPLTTPAAADPLVTTREGALQGVQQGEVRAFLGIPFAAPPTGANRWRAPQPVRPWQGIRPATAFGHSCWQSVTPTGFGPWTHEYVTQGDISEDCLFLNVWTPAEPAGKLPVLVWIYGGGFSSGSGALPIYEGRALAGRGIVVVTINYRVGPFGFLAHPELTAEANGAPPANFGLQDMIASLKWVQSNIAAFGGDPRAVTIAGQSAGAMGVHALIASPLAKGLFRHAIVQSGLPAGRPVPALAVAEPVGLAFAQEKGATSLAALRALPAEALQPGSGGNAIRFGPVVDGLLLTEDPAAAIASGRAADVPMMAGLAADEGTALAQDYGSADAAALQSLLQDSFGAMADRFAPLYPAASDADRVRSNIQIRRDRGVGAIYAWARQRIATGWSPLFVYRFSHVPPGPDAARWRAFHSSELPYVFDTLDAAPERGFTDADRALARTVSTYWINFVKTGDPNGADLPLWPRFAASQPQILEIGDEIAPTPLLPADKLALIRDHIAAGGELTIF